MNKNYLRAMLFRLTQMICVAVLYYATARLSAFLALSPENVTVLWPAAGLALAAVFVWGWPAGIGVWVGSFLFHWGTLTGAAALPASSAIAAGSALQAGAAVWLLKRIVRTIPPATARGALLAIGVMALAALVAPAVEATSLCLAGLARWSNFLALAQTSWLCDLVGMTVFAPTLVILSSRWRKRDVSPPLLWVLTCFIIGMALGISLVIANAEQRRLSKDLRANAQEVARVLQSELDHQVRLQASIEAFYFSSAAVTAEEFATFTSRLLEHSPAAMALEWVPRVTQAERSAYEDARRAQGAADYYIYEQDSSGKHIPAGDRAEYFPVTLISPFAPNQAAFGFDLGSNPTRLGAIQRARDSGEAASASPVQLVQTAGKVAGVLIMLPVYRVGMPASTPAERQDALWGLALGVYRADTLVQQALAQLSRHDLEYYVYDLTNPQSPQFLAFYPSISGPQTLPAAGAPALDALLADSAQSAALTIGADRWLLLSRPGPRYASGSYGFLPWVSLLFGLAIAGGFLIYVANRQKTEAILARSEAEYRTLSDDAPTGILRMTLAGEILYANDALASTIGLESAEALRDNVRPHIADEAQYQAALKLLQEHGRIRNQELDALTVTGEARHLLCSALLQDGVVSATLVDLTDRIRAGKEFQQLSRVVSQMADSVVITDVSGVIEYVNPAFERLTGYTRDEALGQTPRILKSGQHSQEFYADLWQTILAGEVYQGEMTNRKKDGEIFVEAKTITPIRDAKGAITHFVATGKDITERKQMESALRQREADYHLIAENTSDAIWIMDLETESFIYVSPSVARLLGFTPAEMLARPMRMVITAESLQMVLAALPQRIEAFRHGLGGTTQVDQLDQIRHDGSVVHTEVATTLVITEAGRLQVVGISRDISERRRAEEELARSKQRLEATLNALPDLLFELDENRRFVDYRAPSRVALFVPPEFFIGKTIYQVMPADVTTVIDWALDEALQHGTHFGATYALPMAGKMNWYELSVSTRREGAGQSPRFIVLAHDCTERKLAQSLQETVYRIADVAQTTDSLQDMYAGIHRQIAQVMPADNFYIALYDEASGLLRFPYSVDERVPFVKPVSPGKGLTAHVLRTGASLLYTMDRAWPDLVPIGDLSKVWLGVPLVVRGKTIGVMAVHHYSDASVYTEREQHMLEFVSSQVATAIDRKQADETLRKSQAGLEIAQATAHLGSWEHNPNTGEGLSWSREMFTLFGLDPAAGVPTVGEFMELIVPADRQAILDAQERAIQTDQPVTVDYRTVPAGGVSRCYQATIAAVRNTDGSLRQVSGTVLDITARKRAEETIRESERRLKQAQQIAHVGSWELDIQSGELKWSDEIYRIFDLRPQEFAATYAAFLDVIHPADRDMVNMAYTISLQTRQPYDVIHRLLTRDGRLKYVQERCETTYDENGVPIRSLGTVQDITERHEMELEIGERMKELTCLFSVSQMLEDVASEPMLCQKIVEYLVPAMQFPECVATCLVLDGRRYTTERYHDGLTHRLSTPIVVGGVPRGEVSVYYTQDLPFLMPHEQSLIDNAARMLSIWLERRQSELAMQAAQRELEEVNRELEKRVEERAAEARQNEMTYRALFENSNDAIFLMSPAGKDLAANPQALIMLGYTADEYLARAAEEDNVAALPERRADALVRFAAVLRGEHVPLYEQTLVGKDGKPVEVEINLSAVRDPAGNIIMVQSVVRNITERKKAQEALRQSRDQLSIANAALEKASRLKDEFLASMSHELRTPLTGILGMTEVMQMQIAGPLNEKQMKSLKNIASSGRHLLDLINDILDLSKIEAGKLEMQFEMCAAADICQASLQLVKGMAGQKRQNIAFSITPAGFSVRADSRRLKQMLVNLLSNAVKFTPVGGSLGLEVKVCEDEQTVHFTVWDKGIGIKPEDLGKLFKPFSQLDNRLARQYAGTGLGLSLVHRMAEMHGGSVKVESVLGEGSRFSIVLPWTPDVPEPEAEPTPAGADGFKSALVIEDNDLHAEQAAVYLREMGIRTVVHPTAHGALEKAAHLRPSAILLDLNLPDGSGMDLLALLKADERTREIPVIIVSVEERRTEAMKLGVAGYMVKPYSKQELHAALFSVAASGQLAPAVMVIGAWADAPLILLADDNEVILETISDFLKAKGFRVIATRSGLELLERASELHPDLILMDIQMPGMDGMETMHRVRAFADRQLAETPIIAVTALAMTGDRERCMQAGANDYLSKPIGLAQLLERIRLLLRDRARPAAGGSAEA